MINTKLSYKNKIQFFAEENLENEEDISLDSLNDLKNEEVIDSNEEEMTLISGNSDENDGNVASDADGQTDFAGKRVLSSIFDIVEVFSYAIALMVVVFLFVIKFVTVDGDSMLNTLHDEDRLIIYNLFYTPETNDIIVINCEERGYDELLVKRVIGVEGDTVKINFNTWEVWVNGELIDQSYLDSNSQKGVSMMNCGMFSGDMDENKCVTFTVDEGKVFVMGDNRNFSMDSRAIGQLNIEDIMGKVVFRVSPAESIGTVE